MTDEKLYSISKKLSVGFNTLSKGSNFFSKFSNLFKKTEEYFSNFDSDDFLKIYVFTKTLTEDGLDTPLSVLLEKYENTQITLMIYTNYESVEIECSECDGDGEEECQWCDGGGEVSCPICDGSGEDEEGERCDECSGKGVVECPDCNGSGQETCSQCDGSGEIVDDDETEITNGIFMSDDPKLNSNLLSLKLEDLPFSSGDGDFPNELFIHNTTVTWKIKNHLEEDEWYVREVIQNKNEIAQIVRSCMIRNVRYVAGGYLDSLFPFPY
jgi:hypothetical protein